ncbi:hypothetical protein ABKN59_000610 [Abortiporus biennis]
MIYARIDYAGSASHLREYHTIRVATTGTDTGQTFSLAKSCASGKHLLVLLVIYTVHCRDIQGLRVHD